MLYPTLKPGYFIWTSPPCLGHIMVEELRRCRHKRQNSWHLVLIPRIMSPMWRKQLHKGSDLVLRLPPGHVAWPSNMHEPLTIAFLLPFIRHRPWQLRGSIYILGLGRELSRMWQEDHTWEGSLLRKLWETSSTLSCLSAKLAWKVLRGSHDSPVPYSSARKRRRHAMEITTRRNEVPDCKKRRHDVSSVPM